LQEYFVRDSSALSCISMQLSDNIFASSCAPHIANNFFSYFSSPVHFQAINTRHRTVLPPLLQVSFLHSECSSLSQFDLVL
jgi:hypothetical protein